MNNLIAKTHGSNGNTSIQIIKVKGQQCALLLSKAQWLKETPIHLPNFYSDDYSYIADIQYQEYLKSIQGIVSHHQYTIPIIEPKCHKETTIKTILLTMQSTLFDSAISLIIKDFNDETVILCELTGLTFNTLTNEHFKDTKFDILKYVDIDELTVPAGYSLDLTLNGGVILTDNILLSEVNR